MRLLMIRFVLLVALMAGCVGLKSLQFRLEGLSAGQSHLLSDRGNGGGPSYRGGGVRRISSQDKKIG